MTWSRPTAKTNSQAAKQPNPPRPYGRPQGVKTSGEKVLGENSQTAQERTQAHAGRFYPSTLYPTIPNTPKTVSKGRTSLQHHDRKHGHGQNHGHR